MYPTLSDMMPSSALFPSSNVCFEILLLQDVHLA